MKYSDEYSNDEKNQIGNNFRRLKGVHYLDHAGATQYSEHQMQQIYSNLSSNVYCNPHTSKMTEDLVDQVRYRILKWFNASSDDYAVIFTSGATAALKLVAETFDFGDSTNGSFMYLRDNHTSVLGMREIVKTNNIVCVEHEQFMRGKLPKSLNNSLLVYPAQCNFSGFKYPLDAVNRFQTSDDRVNVEDSHNYVCLDAAAFVSTNPLDLSKYRPDFVCVSFYKMFGYPTGLGALIVSRRGEQNLNKSYYGGGTVKIAMSNKSGWHCKRDLIHERFEDGTIPYLSIISLLAGYDTIEKLVPRQPMQRASRHCFNLAKYLYGSLKELKYSNGRSVVKFYHDSNFVSASDQGGIVNFNILHEDGTYVGFSEVACMAQLHNIYLRTGCFCNPGACQRHLGLTDDDLQAHFQAGHVCGDENDLINGVPTGSVRVSMGYMTTVENVEAVINLVKKCFCNKVRNKYLKSISDSLSSKYTPANKTAISVHPLSVNAVSVRQLKEKPVIKDNDQLPENILKDHSRTDTKNDTNAIKLHEICVYPIKSCAPYRVDGSWIVNRRGLKYDRGWMIVRSTGVAMTQKMDTKLCHIQPTINEAMNILSISFPYAKTIHIPLRHDETDNRVMSQFCQSKVCGDRIEGIDCGDEVAEWLDDVLCTSGLRLFQQHLNDKRTAKNNINVEQSISLSNQAQFLLINVASVDWLTKKVEDWIELDDVPEKVLKNTVDRFRANFIIESPIPLEESEWKSIRIGNFKLTTTGPCTRCQMICIDQSTGEKTTEPLQTIAREFSGKMRFGIYLCQDDGASECERSISCGDYVEIEK